MSFFCSQRKFGSLIYELASEKTLMFWGGELTKDIPLSTLMRRGPTGNRGPTNGKQLHSGIFEVKIANGLPRCSR